MGGCCSSSGPSERPSRNLVSEDDSSLDSRHDLFPRKSKGSVPNINSFRQQQSKNPPSKLLVTNNRSPIPTTSTPTQATVDNYPNTLRSDVDLIPTTTSSSSSISISVPGRPFKSIRDSGSHTGTSSSYKIPNDLVTPLSTSTTTSSKSIGSRRLTDNLPENFFKQVDWQLQDGIELGLKEHKSIMTNILEHDFLTELEIKTKHDFHLQLIMEAFVRSVSEIQDSIHLTHPTVHRNYQNKMAELDALINSQLPFYIRKHEILMDNLSRKAKECTNACDLLYEDLMEDNLNKTITSNTLGLNLTQCHEQCSRQAMNQFEQLIFEVGLRTPHFWEFELKAKITERWSEYQIQYPQFCRKTLGSGSGTAGAIMEIENSRFPDDALGPLEPESGSGHQSDSGSETWDDESGDSVDSIGFTVPSKDDHMMKNDPKIAGMLRGVRIRGQANLGSINSILSDGSVDESPRNKGNTKIHKRPGQTHGLSSVELAPTEKSSVTSLETMTHVPGRKGQNPVKPKRQLDNSSVEEKGPIKKHHPKSNAFNDFFPKKADRPTQKTTEKTGGKSNLIGPMTSTSLDGVRIDRKVIHPGISSTNYKSKVDV